MAKIIIDVFEKHITTKDGKKFSKLVSNMTKKDGSKVYVSVNIPDDVKKGVEFPKTVTFDSKNANMSTKVTTDKDGNEYTNNTLWIKSVDSFKDYIDSSLDDFI